MVLLLVVCFGMPIVITTNVITAPLHGPVSEGVQVGGPIRGTLLDEEGANLGPGHRVDLFLAATGAAPVPAGEANTDAMGAFEVLAPAHEGSYLLKFGGGEWLRQSVPFSFLDEAEEAFELVMIRGCTLDVHVVRLDDSPVTGGVAYLNGRVGTHLLFGLLDGRFTKELPFEGAHVRLDGMPPMILNLRLVLGGGDVVELEIALEPGAHTREVKY
ncbi:MAG TPA: hypothetical protein EYQ02_15005 [Microbacterium sp.]|nr:hypothetical protein [Microbacterium sp.]